MQSFIDDEKDSENSENEVSSNKSWHSKKSKSSSKNSKASSKTSSKGEVYNTSSLHLLNLREVLEGNGDFFLRGKITERVLLGYFGNFYVIFGHFYALFRFFG